MINTPTILLRQKYLPWNLETSLNEKRIYMHLFSIDGCVFLCVFLSTPKDGTQYINCTVYALRLSLWIYEVCIKIVECRLKKWLKKIVLIWCKIKYINYRDIIILIILKSIIILNSSQCHKSHLTNSTLLSTTSTPNPPLQTFCTGWLLVWTLETSSHNPPKHSHPLPNPHPYA